MDFSKLKWDVSKQDDCFKKYPELKAAIYEFIKDTTLPLPTITIGRFIVLTYAMKSPFVEQEENLLKRKRDVCRFLKLNLEEDSTKALVSNVHRELCHAICGFLQLEDRPEWAQLMINIEVANSIQADLLSSESNEKNRTDALFKLNKDIFPEIERLKSIIFSKDKDVSNKLGSFLVEKRMVFPEDFAQKNDD